MVLAGSEDQGRNFFLCRETTQTKTNASKQNFVFLPCSLFWITKRRCRTFLGVGGERNERERPRNVAAVAGLRSLARERVTQRAHPLAHRHSGPGGGSDVTDVTSLPGRGAAAVAAFPGWRAPSPTSHWSQVPRFARAASQSFEVLICLPFKLLSWV